MNRKRGIRQSKAARQSNRGPFGYPATGGLLVAICLVAGLSAGCVGNAHTNPPTNTPPASLTFPTGPPPRYTAGPLDSPTAPVVSTTPGPDPAPTNAAAVGQAADSAGNKVSFALSYGTPTVLSNLSQPAATVCNDAIATAGSTPDRAIAVPITVSMTVTSGLAATVVAHLGDVEETIYRSSTLPSDSTILWAKNYTAGPICGDSNDVTAANIKWDNLLPHNPSTWTGWIIIVGAISPNDPTGLSGVVTRLVVGPTVEIGDETVRLTYRPADSPNLITCDTGPWIAINPAKATSVGCVKG